MIYNNINLKRDSLIVIKSVEFLIDIILDIGNHLKL